MERSRFVIFMILFGLPAAGVCQSGDVAYVDGPGGRGLYDPARADGGTVAARAEPAAPNPAAATAPAPQAQMQQMLAAMQAAQQQGGGLAGGPAAGQLGQQLGGVAGAGAYPGGGPGVPAGMTQPYGAGAAGYGGDPDGAAGYGMQPQAIGQGGTGGGALGPQLRSGLLQDVGGLIDAGIQRQVYPDGRINTTPAPGSYEQGNPSSGW